MFFLVVILLNSNEMDIEQLVNAPEVMMLLLADAVAVFLVL